jgi:hypothetical protein
MTQAGVSVADMEDILVCGDKLSLNSKTLTNGAFSAVVSQLSTKLVEQNTALGPIAECP